MKILLQDPESELFLAADGSWSDKWEEAQSFENALRAFDFSMAHHLHGLKIVVKYVDSQINVALDGPP